VGNFLRSGLSIIIGTLMCLAPLSNPVSAAAAADYESYTFKLTQSTAAYQFWTMLPSEHVFKDSPVPASTGSEVKVYAAQNEFEPFQIVLTLTSSVVGNSFTATVPYSGGVMYFALKSQAATGAWSGLSNNAFWPYHSIFLPVIRR